ncbi:hypothetical protein GCM10007063_24010 [Lentibacillus kapialis]|uniref:Uncharacterized protein n=1 Tax=Lentibacillus kapialis TaxID=340214 RepID=A0A917UYY2_9BACI|nr:hypothetical protein [Lentibacillus kapialis]GGK00897.1 hypothetical protein GCM10007063_24010 [Lentibacillus kapialis]
MKQAVKLGIIGVIGGIILLSLLKIVQVLTGSQAYVLLFNTDYIPLMKDWGPKDIGGFVFHFVFCIVSVVALFHILKICHLERSVCTYFMVYTGGSAVLYILTGLTDRPPAITDAASWTYWTAAHAVYSITVGFLVKHWV